LTDIQRAIPHKPPFLLIDRVVSVTDECIVAEACPKKDGELFSLVFAGHYPGNPVTPGVLLCEMVFQAGAVLLSHRMEGTPVGTVVLVKISSARFKHMVKPGDDLLVEVKFIEQIAHAFVMKGTVRCDGNMAVRVEFTCALIAEPTEQENS
jgi:3-hydroxyacyl-[acyl-carrier-protein] dehydratase